MAKGKRAAALFEVIQAAKQKEQIRAGGGFLTPSWWFKGKGQKNGAANGAAGPVPQKSPPPIVAPLKITPPARKTVASVAKISLPEPIVEEASESAPIDIAPAPEISTE